MTGRPDALGMTRLAVLLFVALVPAARAEESHPLDRAAAVLARLRPLVEKECRAEFPKPPEVRELTAAAAGLAFEADLADEIARSYPGTTAGQRRALLESAARASVDSCVARYSTTLRAIVLVRAAFDRQARRIRVDRAALLEAALAHEAVHALDDARFDLDKLSAAATDREAGRALAMVVEGRAVHLGGRVAAARDLPAAVRDLVPEGEGVRGEFLRLTYEGGARFVAALVARGGIDLADRALRSPPEATHLVLQPDRWPDGQADPRPDRILGKASPAAERKPLSELGLRARYGATDGRDAAARLFSDYRGGAQAVVGGTNAVVLAFASEEGAERYRKRAERDAPGRRFGTVVVRAAGAAPEETLVRLAHAAESADETGTDR